MAHNIYILTDGKENVNVKLSLNCGFVSFVQKRIVNFVQFAP